MKKNKMKKKKNTTKSSVLFLVLPKHTCTSHTFCSTVHNAHAYAQPCPHKSFSSQHACHNVPTSTCSPTPHVPQCTRFYSLANSTSVFRGSSEHKEIYALKKKTTVCVRMHWRKRERGVYTHTGQGIWQWLFFLLFQSVTIKSCHIPMTFFWWGGSVSFSYSHQNNNALKFFRFFYYIHIYFTKIDVVKKKTTRGKKSFTHTHTRSLNRSCLVCPAPYIYRRDPSPIRI